MKSNALRWLTVLALPALLVPASRMGTVSAQDAVRKFVETGKSVHGRFLQYWEEHGGLAQQGLPISGEM